MKHAPMWLQLADVPDHMRSPHIIASSDRPPTSATPSSAVAEPTKMMSTSPYCKIRANWPMRRVSSSTIGCALEWARLNMDRRLQPYRGTDFKEVLQGD